MKSINDICHQAVRIIDTYLAPVQDIPAGSVADKRVARIYAFVSRAIDNIASVQWDRTGGKYADGWSDDTEQFPVNIYANPHPKYSYDGAVNAIMEVAKNINQ